MAARAYLALLALAVLAVSGCRGQSYSTPSDAENLDDACTTRLDDLFKLYTQPAVWTEACDQACLSNCYSLIDTALYTKKDKDCPLQTDLTFCFNVSEGIAPPRRCAT